MLDKQYEKTLPELKKALGFKNKMQAPVIQKTVLSTCIGEALKNQKMLTHALNDLSLIAGQKTAVRRAKKAVAQFKTRKGAAIGGSVTLRGKRMWIFLEKLIHFALPRVRDFKGLSPKSFDGCGNYNLGVKEQIIFPEVDYDKVDKVRGFNITICTSAKDDKTALLLLKQLGFPFKSSEKGEK